MFLPLIVLPCFKIYFVTNSLNPLCYPIFLEEIIFCNKTTLQNSEKSINCKILFLYLKLYGKWQREGIFKNKSLLKILILYDFVNFTVKWLICAFAGKLFSCFYLYFFFNWSNSQLIFSLTDKNDGIILCYGHISQYADRLHLLVTYLLYTVYLI